MRCWISRGCAVKQWVEREGWGFAVEGSRVLLVSRGSTTMSCWRVCRWHWVPPTLSKKKCMLELWTVSRVSPGSCSCVQSSLAAELMHPVPEVCNRGEADTETTRARGTTGEGGKERGNAVADGAGGEQRHGGV